MQILKTKHAKNQEALCLTGLRAKPIGVPRLLFLTLTLPIGEWVVLSSKNVARKALRGLDLGATLNSAYFKAFYHYRTVLV